MFSLLDMRHIFEGMDEDDRDQLLAKVFIALMYYGMLRVSEVMRLSVKDVELIPGGNFLVRFPYATKNWDAGFEILLPNNLLSSFNKYYNQIGDEWKTAGKTSRFLSTKTWV